MEDIDPKDLIHLHSPHAIEFTPEGTRAEFAAHCPPGVTADEALEVVRERFGIEDAEVVGDSGTRSERATRSFGFTNWNGSKWKPSGPKKNHGYNPEDSNPNLN
jgi:hypothetical protein